MQLIKWEPLEEIDRFFEDFPVMPSSRFGWNPAMDIFEKNGNVIGRINLPGVNPEKISILVDEDTLRVSGEMEEEKEEEGKQYYRKEIRKGSFSRFVRLPKEVDSSKVKAEYKDGILRITMPVVADQKGRGVKIKVKTSS